MVIVSLAGLLLAGGVLAYREGRRSSRVSSREALVAALGPVSFTEGRITGGFPFASPLSTEPPAWLLSDPALRRAARRIEDLARQQKSPQALADLAILKLFHGKTNEAISLLEAASARAPENLSYQSDLAAAYLARAGDGERPGDLLRALAAADRAVRTEGAPPEARFNRSLALEKLHLSTDARQGWRDVVRQERGSAWAPEAAQRLRRLAGAREAEIWKTEKDRLDSAALRGERNVVAAIVDRFRQPARQYAEEELLAVWAEQTLADRAAGAERALRIARAVGSALAQIQGDSMTRDAVAAIDAVRADPAGSSRLRQLAQGHLSYGEGARHIKNRRIEPAAQALARAEEQLRKAGSPFVFWARFQLAVCEYFRMEYARSSSALMRLRRELPAGRHPVLRGRISIVLGSTHLLTGRPGEGLSFAREAARTFEDLGEIDNLAMSRELLALGFDDLGQPDDAMRHLLLALAQRGRVHNPGRIFALLDLAGMSCLRRGEIDVARYFQNELLSHSLTQRDPSFVSFAHQRRARTLSLAGHRPEALRELDAADREARAIPDPGIRQRQQAEILMLRGEVQIAEAPAAAVRSVSRAIAVFERAGLGYYLSNALFVRARAGIALGDEAGAERDFQAGLRAIERARDNVPEGFLRMALYDQAMALFNEILAFQVRRGAGDRAFEISERVRARELLDRRQPTGAILGLREIQSRLPAGTVLLKYVLLPDRLLLWVLDGDRADLRQVPIGAADLTDRVERVQGDLRRRAAGPAPGQGLRDLHAMLLSPAAGAIRGARTLVVVPDGILHGFPFAALVDPETGRFLVQDHVLYIAPSANVHVRCLERARAAGGGPPASALVVAGDAFDRRRFPRLSPLPEVVEEARAIAASYPQAHLLSGGEATRERFLDLLTRGPQVIHFAGHALINRERPDLSMLVLAGSGRNGETAVYSHEIDGMSLGATRLVVLGACSTAVGRLSASEGANSLARSFLAAGAPAVLASLWDVEDRVASRFLAELHRRLRAGDDPGSALRAVQISEAQGRPPAEWAAFQWIGGLPPHTQEEMRSWHSR